MMAETTYDIDVAIDELIDSAIGSEVTSTVVVHNDDVNTFDWVIECLIDLCDHTYQQAEQLSMLVHFKGKASVKSGSRDYARIIKDGLIDRGLQATIEDFHSTRA